MELTPPGVGIRTGLLHRVIPRSENGRPLNLMATPTTQNAQLARRYKVSGYPTVLFLSKDGKVLGKTGYLKGGPTAWTKNADTALRSRR